MHKRWLAAIVVAGLWCGTAAAIDLGAYVRADKFGDVILSPGAIIWPRPCLRTASPL